MFDIFIICGPTCTGKTSLAIKLCHQFNGEIISADSRQAYKGMDIGTNKVKETKKQRNKETSKITSAHQRINTTTQSRIIIHGYDLINPDEKFSAFDFAVFGQKKIEEIQKRGKIPFVVGGTGFYIDALLGRVEIAGVGADWELREELSQKSLEELEKMLQGLDRERYQNIDKRNRRRLVRAIEIAMSRNQKIKKSKNQRNTDCQLLTANYNLVEIGLAASRKALYQRANQWVDSLVKQGFLDEAQRLIDQGYKNTASMQGMIYKSGIEFLEGKISKEEMLQRIKFDVHDYIRRQLTYFRRNENIRWFDIGEKGFDKKVEKYIQLQLEE